MTATKPERNRAEGRSSGARALPLVSLRYEGLTLGLYGVREAEPKRLVLCHGAISLPVGTQVLVEDLLGLMPGAQPAMLPAQVVDNDSWGLTLAL
jgi:hypothetical protein